MEEIVELNSKKSIRDNLSEVLNNLSDAEALAESPFLNTLLVQEKKRARPDWSEVEALHAVLQELLELIENRGSKEQVRILRLRFWHGLKIIQIFDKHNLYGAAPRTIEKRQEEGLNSLASWFWDREEMLRKRKGLNYFQIPLATYDDGACPEIWEQYGLIDSVRPNIEEAKAVQHATLKIGSLHLSPTEDTKVINFPHLIGADNVIDLIYKDSQLSGSCHTTIRINFCKSYFQSSAGMILGWKNAQTMIRISLSAKLRTFLFEEFQDGKLLQSQEFHRPWLGIWDNRSALLHVQYRSEAQELAIYWSKNGDGFTLIGTVRNVADLQGYMGLCVYPAGNHFPHIQFDTIILAVDI